VDHENIIHHDFRLLAISILAFVHALPKPSWFRHNDRRIARSCFSTRVRRAVRESLHFVEQITALTLL